MTAQLTLASLNLFNYCAPPYSYYQIDECYDLKQWHAKSKWLEHVVNTVKPDILALQEVFSIQSLQQSMAELNLHHFAICDAPTLADDNEFLYTAPIVALASRYPISHIAPIEVNTLPTENQRFSRVPLEVVIEHPEFGPIRVVVVHLKSQRAISHELALNEPQHQFYGRLLALQQRFQEAMWLYLSFLLSQQTRVLPTFIMGDFNQQLDNSSLEFLLTQSLEEPQSLSFELVDAFSLTSNSQNKPFTHYYQGQGKHLDYILTNKDILSMLAAKQLSYHQLDDYLDCSDKPLGSVSDHSCIYLTIET